MENGSKAAGKKIRGHIENTTFTEVREKNLPNVSPRSASVLKTFFCFFIYLIHCCEFISQMLSARSFIHFTNRFCFASELPYSGVTLN